MCFNISKSSTRALQAKKGPITVYKYVEKRRDREHPTSCRDMNFAYPLNGIVKVPRAMAATRSWRKVSYSSPLARKASQGIYANRRAIDVDASSLRQNYRILTLEVMPRDILAVGEGNIVARKVKVVACVTPKRWLKDHPPKNMPA